MNVLLACLAFQTPTAPFTFADPLCGTRGGEPRLSEIRDLPLDRVDLSDALRAAAGREAIAVAR